MNPPKKRQYPKTITVRGEEWTIKFVRTIKDGPLGQYDINTLGLCDPDERTIYIRLKQSERETFKTFIHELVHALEAEWDFDLPHTTANDIVDKLERGLADLLLNNF